MKFQQLQKLVSKWTGSNEEGFQLLKAYIKSPLWRSQCEDDENSIVDPVLQMVGKKLCESVNSKLPPTSPLRKEIINLVSQDLSVSADLKLVLNFSRRTLSKAKELFTKNLTVIKSKHNTIVSFQSSTRRDIANTRLLTRDLPGKFWRT